MRGYKLSEEMVRAVRAVIKDFQNERQFSTSKKGYKRERVQQEDIVQVKCTTAIPAATDSFTSPSTSGKAKLQLVASDGSLSDYSPEIEVEVINHSESDSWAVDDYLKIHMIDGRWHPYTGSGGGGGGGSTCCQVETEIFDIITTNGQPGSGKRSITNSCDGGAPLACRAYFDGTSDATKPGGTGVFAVNNRNAGYVEWSTASAPELTYDPIRDMWLKDVSSEISVYDSSGTDVTGSSTGIEAELQERPDGSTVVLWMQATYSGAQKYAFFQWQVDVPTPSLSRPPLTKSRTYSQLTSYDRNIEVGSLHLCSKPIQSTPPSGTVDISLVPEITSSTDSDFGATLTYTITLKVVNDTSESITVHYDPNDMIGGHWLAWEGNVGYSLFATATTYSVAAGATNNKVVLTRSHTIYWGYGNPTPDAIRIVTGGEQYAIGDTSTDQYDSGYISADFTYYRGGDILYA
jgi:hypothetical protein